MNQQYKIIQHPQNLRKFFFILTVQQPIFEVFTLFALFICTFIKLIKLYSPEEAAQIEKSNEKAQKNYKEFRFDLHKTRPSVNGDIASSWFVI